MRKVVLDVNISLDGYIARRDGTLDFLHISSDYSMAEFFRGIDIGICGRKTLDAAIALDGHGLDFCVLSRSAVAQAQGRDLHQPVAGRGRLTKSVDWIAPETKSGML